MNGPGDSRVERLLAEALTSADPARIVTEAIEDQALAEEERAALRSIDLDGLRISALLVAKLRFERLLQGSATAGAAFDADPRAFTMVFKQYHLEVSPQASTPSEEAARFDQWTAARSRP